MQKKSNISVKKQRFYSLLTGNHHFTFSNLLFMLIFKKIVHKMKDSYRLKLNMIMIATNAAYCVCKKITWWGEGALKTPPSPSEEC